MSTGREHLLPCTPVFRVQVESRSSHGEDTIPTAVE